MSRYDDIWHDHVSDNILSDISDRTGYTYQEIEQAHLDVYLGTVDTIGREEFSQGEIYSLWMDYCDAFVGPTGDQFSRDTWFENMGIDEGDFDWEGWREAMGY